MLTSVQQFVITIPPGLAIPIVDSDLFRLFGATAVHVPGRLDPMIVVSVHDTKFHQPARQPRASRFGWTAGRKFVRRPVSFLCRFGIQIFDRFQRIMGDSAPTAACFFKITAFPFREKPCAKAITLSPFRKCMAHARSGSLPFRKKADQRVTRFFCSRKIELNVKQEISALDKSIFRALPPGNQ
jgi:hypothetical protein